MAEPGDFYYSDTEKQERFNRAIEALENRYRSFFESRKSFLHPGQPDRLIHHVKISYHAKGKRLLFHKKSDLPNAIRDDVNREFRLIWVY